MQHLAKAEKCAYKGSHFGNVGIWLLCKWDFRDNHKTHIIGKLTLGLPHCSDAKYRDFLLDSPEPIDRFCVLIFDRETRAHHLKYFGIVPDPTDLIPLLASVTSTAS
jgi:hypothetical protein